MTEAQSFAGKEFAVKVKDDKDRDLMLTVTRMKVKDMPDFFGLPSFKKDQVLTPEQEAIVFEKMLSYVLKIFKQNFPEKTEKELKDWILEFPTENYEAMLRAIQEAAMPKKDESATA